MRYSRLVSQSLSRRHFHTNRFPQPTTLINSCPSKTKTPNFINPGIGYSSNLNLSRDLASAAQESKPPAQSERVSAIVDELSGLTLLEVADLTELLRKKLNIDEMPVMAVMMPGMGLGGGVKGKSREAAAKGEEKKVEKTAFDLKLEGGFDAGAKIKIIKEVRTFTNLGLKEAKDLVEKAPTLLKKGVTKEEAEKIIEKMKEIGAKVIMD